jgi:ribosomal-protein-alanine N-acetyltransferase
MTIPAIETARLLLRGPNVEDLDDWAACYANPNVVRYLPKRDLTPRARAERVSAFISQLWEPEAAGGYGWVIARKSDQQFIGLCHLEGSPGADEAELSYLLNQPYWGQGLATEASRAAVRYGFEHSAWRRIVAATLPENTASQRVLKHIGFVFEKNVNHFEMTGAATMQPDSPMVPLFALQREEVASRQAVYPASG